MIHSGCEHVSHLAGATEVTHYWCSWTPPPIFQTVLAWTWQDTEECQSSDGYWRIHLAQPLCINRPVLHSRAAALHRHLLLYCSFTTLFIRKYGRHRVAPLPPAAACLSISSPFVGDDVTCWAEWADWSPEGRVALNLRICTWTQLLTSWWSSSKVEVFLF